MIYRLENLSFQILSVARFAHRDGGFSVKGRPFAALSFRESGSGEAETATGKFSFAPGDIIFIPANVDYHVTYTGGGTSLVVHLLDCNYETAERVANAPHLAAAFERMEREWNGARRGVNRAKAAVFEIFAALEEENAPGEGGLLAGAVAFLRENYHDPCLSVPALCRAAHMSEATLRRQFRRCFGSSPRQYLEELRLGAAIRLLQEGAQSVKEIAAACGFADEKYFSRRVRARFGRPPSALYDQRRERSAPVPPGAR